MMNMFGFRAMEVPLTIGSIVCSSEVISLCLRGCFRKVGEDLVVRNFRQSVLCNNTRMRYKGHEAERSVLRLDITPVSDIAFSYIMCFLTSHLVAYTDVN